MVGRLTFLIVLFALSGLLSGLELLSALWQWRF